MIRKQFLVKPRHAEKLKDLKEFQGESESHYVRQAIDRIPDGGYLRKRAGKPLAKRKGQRK